MTLMTSRRTFLATSALSLAQLRLGPLTSGDVIQIRAHEPIDIGVPGIMDPAQLRALAQAGVDTARQLGADYADIRVGDARRLMVVQSGLVPPWSWLDYTCSYGVRVRIAGAQAFAFGTEPTTDAVVRAVRSAIATARGYASIALPLPPLVPAPALQGEWATPVGIDPFSLSADEHAQVVGAFKEAAERVPDAKLNRDRVEWFSETRVFASTEGALLTQRLANALPAVRVAASKPHTPWMELVLPLSGLAPASGGFERVAGAEIQERIKTTAEEAIRLINVPEGEADIGRYNVVFDGEAMAALAGATLARGLELDRVLGYDADGAGTSFLSPVDEILGVPLFSPQLTVVADRTLPNFGMAKWDDDGVATQSFPVIRNGVVVDYFTTRATAAVLQPWYQKQGLPLAARGAAVAWTAALPPLGCASHLTVQPGESGTTLDALLRQMSDGLLVRGIAPYLHAVSVDQQLASGLHFPMAVFEVKKGVITRRLRGAMVQFATKQLWKSLVAVGDRSTVHHHVQDDWRGVYTSMPIVAPAGYFRQIDIIRPRY
jgi:TldD protein